MHRSRNLCLALIALTAIVGVAPEARADADTRRALLIGISKYDAGCPPNAPSCRTNNLAGPAYDLVAMRDVLKQRFGFSDSQITVLADGAATKGRVLSALQSLTQWAQPGRQVFIYFSGHGTGPQNPAERLQLPDGSGALVLAQPARPTGDMLADQLLVGRTELRPLLAQIDAAGTQVFAIFDACYSRDSVRSTRFAERRFRDLRSGDGAGFDGDRIDVSSLRNQPATAEDWPYRSLVYYSAASANETALDLAGELLRSWPTFDGQPHGALTDAVLRVMSGIEPYTDADGDQRMSYAELFAAVEQFMRRRQYPHSPHRQPFALSAAVSAERLASTPVLEVGASPAPPVTPTPSVRVNAQNLSPQAERALAAIKGLELATDSAEYTIEARGALYLMRTAHGEALLQDRAGAAQLLTLTELVESLTMRARLRQLLAIAQQRGAKVKLEAGPGEPDTGGTLQAGEPLTWVARSAVDGDVLLLHVMGDGSARAWLPARNDGGACESSARLDAGATRTLCRWSGATPPYGLDALYVFQFEGKAPAIPQLAGGPFTSGALDQLESALRSHGAAVAAVERTIFTVYRP